MSSQPQVDPRPTRQRRLQPRRHPSPDRRRGKTADRVVAVTSPLLLFTYGAIRLIDGLDGNHGPGIWWTVGHLAFLLAILGFGWWMVRLRASIDGSITTRRAADAALAAGTLGVLAFSVVIVGDLSEQLAVNLPDAVMAAGPLLFQAGLVGLLLLTTRVGDTQGRWWHAVIVLAGFALLALQLDLLPLSALIILAGVMPYCRTASAGLADPAVHRPPR